MFKERFISFRRFVGVGGSVRVGLVSVFVKG